MILATHPQNCRCKHHGGGNEVAAHEFKRRGWRFWICDHCFAPKSLHPRPGYRRARPLGQNYFLSKDAPHFKEGW